MKNFIVVISGPTATGKSDFALRLAYKIGGEIINADIGSWYTPLTIGTAKPDWGSESVAHHLFDILDQPAMFNVVQFRNLVKTKIEEIWARGKTPIVVGGSAFYIKSLWFTTYDLFIDESSKVAFEQEVQSTSTYDLWNELYDIDGVRARQIHKNDRYRIVRALSIYKMTGQSPSEYAQKFDPIVQNIAGIVCMRDRQDLYTRINQRTEEMLRQGWIDEVRHLLRTPWQSFLLEKKIIGYDDIIKHLTETSQQHDDYVRLVDIIRQKTRRYAKRQITFLKKMEKDVAQELQRSHCVGFMDQMNLTLCDVGLYIDGLSNRLLQIFG